MNSYCLYLPSIHCPSGNKTIPRSQSSWFSKGPSSRSGCPPGLSNKRRPIFLAMVIGSKTSLWTNLFQGESVLGFLLELLYVKEKLSFHWELRVRSEYEMHLILLQDPTWRKYKTNTEAEMWDGRKNGVNQWEQGTKRHPSSAWSLRRKEKPNLTSGLFSYQSHQIPPYPFLLFLFLFVLKQLEPDFSHLHTKKSQTVCTFPLVRLSIPLPPGLALWHSWALEGSKRGSDWLCLGRVHWKGEMTNLALI